MTEALIEKAQKAFSESFGAVLELKPESGASVFVDGRATPPAKSAALPKDKKIADCIWRCPDDIMARVLSSKRAVENAVINGRLVIGGDMSVMARLRLSA